MKIPNDILIPMKVYMLSPIFHAHNNKIKNILNLCINFAMKESDLDIHIKLFYILLNAEFFRQIKDDNKMILNRQRAQDICSDNTFKNYLLIVNSTVRKADSEIVSSRVKKIPPSKGESHIRVIGEDDDIDFFTEQDSSNIPCELFNYSLDDIEQEDRYFLEKVRLMDLIKKDLGREVWLDCKYSSDE